MPPRLSILAAVLVLAAVAARAEAAPDTAKAAHVSRIQMTGLMAPVRWTSGRVGTLAVTPLLDLADDHAFDAVCDLTPRIVDTVITVLAGQPIPSLGRGKLDVEAIGPRLTKAINDALGRPLIGAVDLVPGVRAGRAVDERFAGAAPCGRKKAKEKSQAE